MIPLNRGSHVSLQKEASIVRFNLLRGEAESDSAGRVDPEEFASSLEGSLAVWVWEPAALARDGIAICHRISAKAQLT